jgi:hypothetical protein
LTHPLHRNVQTCQPDTQHLLGSVFGDVPNLALLSDRVHQVSGGNPGACVSLADWLVEHGLVRYEAGSWSLPQQLRVADLPAGEGAWTQRLASLTRWHRASRICKRSLRLCA